MPRLSGRLAPFVVLACLLAGCQAPSPTPTPAAQLPVHPGGRRSGVRLHPAPVRRDGGQGQALRRGRGGVPEVLRRGRADLRRVASTSQPPVLLRPQRRVADVHRALPTRSRRRKVASSSVATSDLVSICRVPGRQRRDLEGVATSLRRCDARTQIEPEVSPVAAREIAGSDDHSTSAGRWRAEDPGCRWRAGRGSHDDLTFCSLRLLCYGVDRARRQPCVGRRMSDVGNDKHGCRSDCNRSFRPSRCAYSARKKRRPQATT